MDFTELIPEGGNEFAAQQKPHAAHVAEDLEFGVERLESGHHEGAARLHLREEFRRRNLGEDRFPDGARESVAAEGGTVGAGAEVLCDFVRSQDASDGNAASEPLRGGNDVGADTQLFVGKEGAGTGATRLHFVKDQKGVVLRAEFAHAFGERRIHRQHAAFALYRFKDDGAGLIRNLLFEGCNVVKGEVRDGTGARPEAFGVLILSADAHREERAAVEGMRKGNDFVFGFAEIVVSRAAREFQRRFIGFRAGIREEDAVKPRERREVLRERQRGFVREEVAQVAEFLTLLFKGLADDLGGVSETVDGNAAAEIDVFTAFAVPKATFLTADENGIGGVVAGDHDVVIISTSNGHHNILIKKIRPGCIRRQLHHNGRAYGTFRSPSKFSPEAHRWT